MYYLPEGKMVQRCLETCLRLHSKQEAVRNISLNFDAQPPPLPAPPHKTMATECCPLSSPVMPFLA